ncbi:MAG: hypothetical protein M1819_006962 [Sarea resinae]|nr:MAG: hypothetical protein M1819_006962 [Sarea resinae]
MTRCEEVEVEDPLKASKIKNKTPSSKPINDSPCRRALLLTVFRVLRRWRPSPTPRVIILTPHIVLKYGRYVSLSEAHAMEFVSRNSQVPVPRVVAAFESRHGCRYMFMTRIKGTPLSDVFDEMDEETKDDVLRQLRMYIQELREIRPPTSGFVGATDLTPLHDERVYQGALGPFENVKEFHTALCGGFEEPTGHTELDKLIEQQKKQCYTSRLTHGDLSFRNVIIRHNRVVGIVDWESAGWYPDYWEYASTWYSFFDCQHLRRRIDEFLTPYPERLNSEKVRRSLFNNT